MSRLWRVIAFSVALGVLVMPAVGAVAADSPPDDKGNLSVVVTDGTSPSPSPSASPSGGGTASVPGTPSKSGSAGTSTTGGAGVAGVPAGNTGASNTPAAGEVSVAGMIYVSGLNSSVAISPDPGEGIVRLWFTVRNASQSTIDATANFWMNGQLFGNRLDSADDVAITALLPGESRVVTTDLHHGGQWTLVDAHVTLTPPETVDGTALTAVTRDTWVFIFPWLIAVGVGVILVGFFVIRAIRASAIMAPPMVDPV